MFEQVIEALKSSFGESIVYKGNGSLNHSFVGVFDEVFTYVHPETGQRVSTDQISILLKLADLPEEPSNRSEFAARNKSYLVRNIERDGRGGARIFVMEKDA